MGLLILVAGITLLAIVDPVQSCHRKVEYHHFYKKQPSKGHGWGWGWEGNGYGDGKGGYGKGWYGGSHGHNKGYGHMQPKGHGGHQGYGHEQKGYGGHKGYGNEQKGHGGHKGYGHEQKGHGGHKGYGHEQKGHEGHKGYGHEQKGHEGHKGYGNEHKGYGHEQKGHGEQGYGHGGGQDHGKGYGQSEHKGYGGHEEQGHGHKGGQIEGYGKGHDDGGHGYGDAGYESGYQMNSPNHKGIKYQHSSYEMSTYGDQGGNKYGGQHNHKGGYNDANQNSKGYGYSGPYPNTEYSSKVVTSVNPPATAEVNDFSAFTDEANDADYLRSLANPNNNHPSYISAPILTDALPLSTSINTSPSNREADLASGNFDLNLEFNSDLPSPFRRSDSAGGGSGIVRKRRKKISSTFKAAEDQLENRSSTENDGLKS